MTRLYINLTNKCNTDCPFCCMWSGSNNNTFISFDVFKTIIDSCNDDFELQLEGGEPFLHSGFYLFIEYAFYTGRCKKLMVLTNGLLLEEHIKKLVDLHRFHKNISFAIKVSANYWLMKVDDKSLKRFIDFYYSTEFIENFQMLLNVRLRNEEDDNIRNEVENYNLPSGVASIYYLQRYGKYENEEDYELPVIVQNIANWRLYASDGTNFGQDIVARSEYEKTLS